MINKEKCQIEIPIYYSQDENKEVLIDVESMRNEFDNHLNELITYPDKFLTIEI